MLFITEKKQSENSDFKSTDMEAEVDQMKELIGHFYGAPMGFQIKKWTEQIRIMQNSNQIE